MDAHPAIPMALLAATEALGETLARTELILLLNDAQARLDADDRAHALLDQMAEADARLRRRQAEGTLTHADIDRVRDAHREASLDPTINGFAAAHQAALTYLPQVNARISELLGWDFAAAVATPASC